MNKYAAIIVAGGAGRRFGSKTPKQFLNLGGLPMYLWSVKAFRKTGRFSQIILAAPAGRLKALSAAAKKYSFDLVSGGKERPDSVRAGLKKLNKDITIVAIHDAARPLIGTAVINRALAVAARSGSALVSVPARDTIKLVSKYKVLKTIPRQTIWQAQTPQVFERSLIEKAYSRLGKTRVTDDAQAVERTGHKVSVVMGDYNNIKITDRNDFNTALLHLKKPRK